MNSFEWDKVRKQQAAEREQLRRLLFGIQGLLTKCRDTAPTEIELGCGCGKHFRDQINPAALAQESPERRSPGVRRLSL